ncbi:TetR/AcrR family transcriptional regulator [Pseudophaeobacter sp.]|uniref:TetR/AcrR family transcriptional regulator n=1 Tax=Pseudophaeobacter sp. TaxID=1971739 RepID=UPI0040584FE1
MVEVKDKKSHHHGDLRAALIQSGIEILTESGLDSLTLRRCAARAGVSHAAPAHHFDGVAGLRGAIAKEGFDRFRQTMLKARAAGGQSPEAHIRSICRGYLDFAVENPALFALIFSCGPMAQFEEDMKAGDASAYGVLRQACAPFVPPGADPRVIETQVWSLIHGFTHLFLAGTFGPANATPDHHALFAPVMSLLQKIGGEPATG